MEKKKLKFLLISRKKFLRGMKQPRQGGWNAAEVGVGVVWFGVGVGVGWHFFQFNLIISFITVYNYNYSNIITSTAIVVSI